MVLAPCSRSVVGIPLVAVHTALAVEEHHKVEVGIPVVEDSQAVGRRALGEDNLAGRTVAGLEAAADHTEPVGHYDHEEALGRMVVADAALVAVRMVVVVVKGRANAEEDTVIAVVDKANVLVVDMAAAAPGSVDSTQT